MFSSFSVGNIHVQELFHCLIFTHMFQLLFAWYFEYIFWKALVVNWVTGSSQLMLILKIMHTNNTLLFVLTNKPPNINLHIWVLSIKVMIWKKKKMCLSDFFLQPSFTKQEPNSMFFLHFLILVQHDAQKNAYTGCQNHV